jgi:hypothetical protein
VVVAGYSFFAVLNLFVICFRSIIESSHFGKVVISISDSSLQGIPISLYKIQSFLLAVFGGHFHIRLYFGQEIIARTIGRERLYF